MAFTLTVFIRQGLSCAKALLLVKENLPWDLYIYTMYTYIRGIIINERGFLADFKLKL